MMAGAYSEITSKLGVCFSTLGPGATNLLTGVANAYQERQSVLVLSGQLRTSKQFLHSHQYVDLKKLYGYDEAGAVTKKAITLKDRATLSDDIYEAIKETRSRPKGPVHVSMSLDILEAMYPYQKTKIYNKSPNIPDVSKLENLLSTSSTIVAIIGNALSVAEYNDTIVQFLSDHKIPTYTTIKAKGILTDAHPQNAGMLCRHSSIARDTLGNVDVVLAIGFDIVEGVLPDIWQGAKNIVHIGYTKAHRYTPDIELVGDIHNIIESIDTNTQNILKTTDVNISPSIPKNIQSMSPMHPIQVIRTVANIVEDKAHITCDVGFHKQFVAAYMPIYKHFVASNGYSTMGYSLPAGMATKLVYPDDIVISFVGDGGMQMNIQELATAVEYELPLICVILNDNALGMVKLRQLQETNTTYKAEYKTQVDFANIAKAYGANGYEVQTTIELENALKDAIKSKKVCVIDVKIAQYIDIV